MTTKVFWSVHFSYPTQDITDLAKLVEFIDLDRKSILVVVQSKENPPIESFLDGGHKNKYYALNRIVLSTDSWGFPTQSEIDRIDEFLKAHYVASLFEADHYLFGQATQDCVARMGSAIIYGSGRSHCEDNFPPKKVDYRGYPTFRTSIRPIDHAHFIEELCYPNRNKHGSYCNDYFDFVRIYDANGNLHRKGFVKLDSIIVN